MRQILALFLVVFMPVVALADGMFIPPVAYPAKITIPDQRALICFSNGTERLVIETRFTASGTNFAWVIPLPTRPVIQEASTGLFPTLQYLFRPQIINDVTIYYLGISALVWLAYILLFVRPTGRLNRTDVTACILLAALTVLQLTLVPEAAAFNWWTFTIASVLVLLDLLGIVVLTRLWDDFGVLAKSVVIFFLTVQILAVMLPALAASRRRTIGLSSSMEAVSILDRKMVGIFETTTISSHDSGALQTWLSQNGYSVPTNTEPVIASYVKDGWVFVAMKVRRDNAAPDTSTPHPVSFTFRTDKPVYPMRLTGLNDRPLSVDLYVFSAERVDAPHFTVASCTRPSIVHPLLCQWTAGLPVATKLKAKLSPADMREDIWLKQTPLVSEQKDRLFSIQGALITALNWGTGFFAAGLVVFGLLAFVGESGATRFRQSVGVLAIIGVAVTGTIYLCLPKIEVKLVTRYSYYDSRDEQLALRLVLYDLDWRTPAEARSGLREIVAQPTNAVSYGVRNWDNNFVGGQIREEDSPGNYLLRETNNELQFVTFDANGAEAILGTWNLTSPH